MLLPNIDDIYIEIINYLPLNDIFNLYITNKHYHNIIKKIPQLEKTLKFVKKIKKIQPEYIVLFIYEELFMENERGSFSTFINNQYELASKLIAYVDTFYDINSHYYHDFKEYVFQYFMGNEFVDKDNVNNFITMFDYTNLKNYIKKTLYLKLSDNVELLFDYLKIVNNINDIEIQQNIKLLWNDNQSKIKNELRPTGFMNVPYSDKYYKKLDKIYNQLNYKYT